VGETLKPYKYDKKKQKNCPTMKTWITKTGTKYDILVTQVCKRISVKPSEI